MRQNNGYMDFHFAVNTPLHMGIIFWKLMGKPVYKHPSHDNQALKYTITGFPVVFFDYLYTVQ